MVTLDETEHSVDLVDEYVWEHLDPYSIKSVEGIRYFFWDTVDGHVFTPVAIGPYACPICAADENSYSLELDEDERVFGYCKDCGSSDFGYSKWCPMAAFPADTTFYPCVNEHCKEDFTILGDIKSEILFRAANVGRVFCPNCGDCLWGHRLYNLNMDMDACARFTPGAAFGRIFHDSRISNLIRRAKNEQ